MKKKNVLVIAGIVILAILVVGFSACYIKEKKERADNRIIYNFVYYDDATPGSKREVTIKENKVEVITTNFCSAKDCKESEPKKEEDTYSRENMKKLQSFLDENFSFKEEEVLEIHENDLGGQKKEILTGVLYGEYFFEVAVEDYKYKLDYSKNENLDYVVYFKEDNSILVKRLKINDDYDITDVKTYPIIFSKNGMNALYDYIEKEARGIEDGVINKNSTLRKDEELIIKSITENDEEHLKDIDSKPSVLYVITYQGVNCLTPTLYLYSDNTYEYYYTFSTDGKKLTPKMGTYDFDIKEVLKSSPSEESKIGYYTIKDNNNKTYKVSALDQKMNELLGSINVSLSKCLEQE